MDILADFAEPLPAIVTAELLGVNVEDHVKLKEWSQTFAEMLGNFQHNPDRLPGVLIAVEALAGRRLHKGNFRRLVEASGLVEPIGRSRAPARGRPAEEFRFRQEVLRERALPGVRLGGTRGARLSS